MTEHEDFTGNVRWARPEEEDSVFALMKLAHGENGLFPMDEEKTRALIRRATSRQFAMIGVIEGPKELEGLIALTISQYWYTNECHLEEVMNFVHPDHRRTTHAKNLIEFAKWCQKGLSREGINVPLIMGVMTHRRLEPKLRLYQRQLPQIGALFQVGLEQPDAFNQRRLPRAS